MKSVIVHVDGRRINLAAAIDAELYEELEGTHSPRNSPVLRCGGCSGGIYIRHGSLRKDELFGAHHNAGTCTETLAIRKAVMSDEHKRQAEYHVLAAQRAGYPADLEVTTTGRTRVDVVVDGRIGFEIQRAALTKSAAVDRTARSVKGGLETVTWFTDRATAPQWVGHVPGYRTAATGPSWATLPLPGSVVAVGLQLVEAVRCGTRRPCIHGRGCTRIIPWLEQWRGMHVDDVVARLADESIRPVKIGKYVRLMSTESIALWEELTGAPLPAYDAGRPKMRLAPSAEQECERPEVPLPALPRDSLPMPPIPATPRPGLCHVPGCEEPAQLYAGGWLCDNHQPARRQLQAVTKGKA